MVREAAQLKESGIGRARNMINPIEVQTMAKGHGEKG
jgi:hypothetical protein